MRKIASILISFILVLCHTNVMADKIVAVIDESPITASEVQNLKKILSYFGSLDEIKKSGQESLSALILNSAISDKLVENYAASSRIKASDAEVDAMLKSLADSRKITPKEMIRQVKDKLSISEKEFKHKLEVEVLRSKIVREIVSRNVEVSEKDVESLALTTNYRDASLDLLIITANDNSDKSLKKMEQLQRKIKNCKRAKRMSVRKFAERSEVTTRLSKLSPSMQTLVRDLPLDTPSNVVGDDKIRIVLVCERIIDEITSQDSYNLTNFLGNRKLQIEAQKFFQDLRKKAYVKIIE